MKRFIKPVLALLLALALAAPAWAAGPAESDIYYTQLSADAREIYDMMLQADIMECLRSGESYTLEFDGPFDDFNGACQAIFSANSYALSAFELNHPEMFWLNGSRDNAVGNSDHITLTVTPSFSSNWADGGRSTYDDAAAVDAVVQQIAAEARAQGGQYAQLLYAHDWLTAHNEYNAEAASAGPYYAEDGYLAWTPLSALSDEYQPICEGYSKAFKLICDALGIPCVTVDGTASGGGHEWNQVLLNGAWYAVDVTFDDPTVYGVSGNVSGFEMHDFFLVGAFTQTSMYRTFSDTHVPNGARIAGTNFTFPELSDFGYGVDPGSPDPEWPEEPEAPDDPGRPADSDDPDDPDESDKPEEPELPEPIVFADVAEDAYYAGAVDWAVLLGVTNGTKLNDENGLNWFSPDATVTRGQAVTFLWRAFGCPEPETEENPFAAVNETDYLYKPVLWAVENGITNGTKLNDENGQSWFSPKDPVQRGQMLTFLWRAEGKPGFEGEGLGGYADAEYWAHEVGALGITEGSYATRAACPRCDVVYYLYQVWILDWIAG